MNVWGKVFAFLVVIAAIVASIFTAKLVQVRNSWTAKTFASKNKFNDLQPKVAALETQIDSLRSEIFRSKELWGNFWPAVQTGVNEDGSLQIGIGSDAGVRPNLLLHGFELQADGTSIYRGSFLPTDVQNATTTLKANWRVNPNEAKTWQTGVWRWRNLVPPGYQENFDKQLTAILKLEETLNDRLRTLKGQKDLLAEANNKLKLREAELIGGEELPKAESIDPEHRDGLVPAIVDAEEDRNKTLLILDELRRSVRSVQEDIEKLQSENIELTGKLPQPGSKLPTTETTQRK